MVKPSADHVKEWGADGERDLRGIAKDAFERDDGADPLVRGQECRCTGAERVPDQGDSGEIETAGEWSRRSVRPRGQLCQHRVDLDGPQGRKARQGGIA